MHLRNSHVIIALSVLLLSACAAVPAHQSLPVAAKDEIKSTDVLIPIRQSEIYVFVPASNVGAATGGGLIGALIDVGINDIRTNKAETAVKPLRDALVDFNFDQVLQSDLKSSLSQMPWMGVTNVHIVKDADAKSLDAALANSTAGAVLFLTTDYHLANDGDVLTVAVTSDLFPNNDALKALLTTKSGSGPRTAPGNALYRDTLTFETRVPNATDDRDHNISIWCTESGSAMRSTLKLAAEKLALMLVADLEGSEESSTGETATVDGFPVQIIGHDADGTFVRTKDGTLMYVTKSIL